MTPQDAYIGYEPARETIMHRCPAIHECWTCEMSGICNASRAYGKTVCVRRQADHRCFPTVPRALRQVDWLYDGPTSVERISGRFKIFWSIDDGSIRAGRRFIASVGAEMVVRAACANVLAAAPRREGTTLGGTKLSPIPKSLRDRDQIWVATCDDVS